MEFFRKTPNIAFMQNRVWCYGISAVLILSSIILLAVRGLNFGIEFTGGVVVEIGYANSVDLDSARDAVEAAGFRDPIVQTVGSSREIMVKVMPAKGEDINHLADRIVTALKSVDATAQLRKTDVIDSQVGSELAEKGGLALLFSMIGILIYVGFRFEKKMATGTVLAALHDPFVILGFFALTQMTFDLAVLAAVLAVMGYSINDTVVVFDRVREVFQTSRKATPLEVINSSVNQTLSRTLMTSFSTLFVVTSLYVVGGESLKGFSIAIIVGIVVGTFSSIFIAAALALDMKLKAVDLLPPQEKDQEVDAMP
ncbi:protein translocase subunit SecF [Povalibacter sp.]|uniref:protein translocase subunit SecF n=1 Tax=Povalibacter sp. TaxID=1962978 RepID=UPI002F41767C